MEKYDKYRWQALEGTLEDLGRIYKITVGITAEVEKTLIKAAALGAFELNEALCPPPEDELATNPFLKTSKSDESTMRIVNPRIITQPDEKGLFEVSFEIEQEPQGKNRSYVPTEIRDAIEELRKPPRKPIAYIETQASDRIHLDTSTGRSFTLIQKRYKIIVQADGKFLKVVNSEKWDEKIIDGQVLMETVKTIMANLGFEVIE